MQYQLHQMLIYSIFKTGSTSEWIGSVSQKMHRCADKISAYDYMNKIYKSLFDSVC